MNAVLSRPHERGTIKRTIGVAKLWIVAVGMTNWPERDREEAVTDIHMVITCCFAHQEPTLTATGLIIASWFDRCYPVPSATHGKEVWSYEGKGWASESRLDSLTPSQDSLKTEVITITNPILKMNPFTMTLNWRVVVDS
ncbi:hypothetical protein BDV93DRAFT_515139 [Ceratobasidium sp. AG-I]|nr:hypothetical protein BDV93DRAFT_515139 [Ceratobasidium sp. AG-I]